MKKLILLSLLCILCIPLVTSASLDTNLYYGLKNNADVKELQTFLIGKGLLNSEATGNFLSLTVSAVKSYQKEKGISQTGFVGVLTRDAINSDKPTAIEALKAQIALLQQQIKALQEQPVIPQVPTTPPTTIQKIKGCMDSKASNFNSSAEENDGTCVFLDVTLEINKTYFMKTIGENFILQTFIYETKPAPYYSKSYPHPEDLYYTINGGNMVFLTKYFGKSCAEDYIAGCTQNSYQYYVKPNITIPKDAVLNIIDMPNQIAVGAFHITSAIFKGETTGKIVNLTSY